MPFACKSGVCLLEGVAQRLTTEAAASSSTIQDISDAPSGDVATRHPDASDHIPAYDANDVVNDMFPMPEEYDLT